jgi:transcriptional regulator with XRE-family HTH domain
MNTRGTNASPSSHRQAALQQSPRAARASAPATRDPGKEPTAVARRRTVSAVRVEDPPLVRALLKEANRRGQQQQEMAETLGCTYGYISQLRGGLRKTEHIGQDFAERAADYLGVPPAVVKLLAGRVTARDFVWPQRSAEEQLAECMDVLRDDPIVGAYVPPELAEAAPAVQQFVWQLYTECTGLQPLATRALPQVLEYLQRAALNEQKFEQRLSMLRETVAEPGAQTREPD